MEDIIGWFIGIIVTIMFIFLGIILFNIISNEKEAKDCVRNGGEPYYFITSFECRNNINVNLGGE